MCDTGQKLAQVLSGTNSHLKPAQVQHKLVNPRKGGKSGSHFRMVLAYVWSSGAKTQQSAQILCIAAIAGLPEMGS